MGQLYYKVGQVLQIGVVIITKKGSFPVSHGYILLLEPAFYTMLLSSKDTQPLE